MKVNKKEYELEMIKPRTTMRNMNFVVLKGFDEATGVEVEVKLTSGELEQIVSKLANLITIRGTY